MFDWGTDSYPFTCHCSGGPTLWHDEWRAAKKLRVEKRSWRPHRLTHTGSPLCVLASTSHLANLGRGGWPSCHKEAWTQAMSRYSPATISNKLHKGYCVWILSMWPTTGSYFTETKFCWNVPVRAAVLPLLYTLVFLLFCFVDSFSQWH